MDGLVLEDISHSFGRNQVLDRVSLKVGTGEIVCLLGPSGCGKTTSLRIAAGLEHLQHGQVRIHGRIVAEPGRELPPEQREIGMVFQDYALFPHLNVTENVCFGLRGHDKAEQKRIADGLLRRLSMQHLADAFPHRLSGGEQQRVALARALAPKPAVMLMDEPFANLDVALRDAVRDDTLNLLKTEQAAALMVTHDPDEAMRMADRIALMDRGRIVQVGTPEQISRHPTSRFSATFLREMNVLSGIVDERNEINTPYGRIPAAALQPGDQADVVVPPEALRLNGSAGAAARVTEVRLLGAYAVITLAGPEAGEPLRAYAFGAVEIRPGSDVRVSIDSAKAFVFPVEKA